MWLREYWRLGRAARASTCTCCALAAAPTLRTCGAQPSRAIAARTIGGPRPDRPRHRPPLRGAISGRRVLASGPRHPERPPDLRARRDGPRAVARARRRVRLRSWASFASASPSSRRCTSSPTAARRRSASSPRRSAARRRRRAGWSTGWRKRRLVERRAGARGPPPAVVCADAARPGDPARRSTGRGRTSSWPSVRPMPHAGACTRRHGRRRARDPRDLAARPADQGNPSVERDGSCRSGDRGDPGTARRSGDTAS